MPENLKLPNTNWWIFYPIKGLEISCKKDPLLNPIFPEFTLASIDDFCSFLSKSKFGKETKNEKLNSLKKYDLPRIKEREDFKAFLAIQRTTKATNDLNTAFWDAEKRVDEIGSLLSIIFLNESKNATTCGLIKWLSRQSVNKFAISLNNSCYSEWGGYPGSPHINFNNLKINRAKLKGIINKKTYKNYTQIILKQNKSCSLSIRKAVVEASLRISEGIHSNNKSSQLLGAVTGIEILLSQSDGYDSIKNRILVLLGKNLFNRFSVDQIFKFRHKYVHEGQQLTHKEISKKSIALAIACLISTSDAGFSFKNKSTFLDYLDYLHKKQKLYSQMGSLEFKKTNSQNCLKENEHLIPSWL